MRRTSRAFLATLLFTALVAVVLVRYLDLAGVDTFAADGYEVDVVLGDVGGLSAGADVRQAGVRVGSVKRLERRGATVVVRARLDPEVVPLFRDARALVREKTPVGERYLALTSGTPEAGAVPDDGVLRAIGGEQAVTVDEVLSTFGPGTRRRLRSLLDDLGGGLDGHGADLNRLIDGASDLTRQGAPAARALATTRRSLGALTDDLGTVTRALADRDRDLRRLVRGIETATTAVAGEADDLRSALRLMPDAVRRTRATTGRLAAFTTRATPVLADIARGLDGLVPAVDRLRPAAVRAEKAVAELDRFTPAVTPLLGRLTTFARTAEPEVSSLRAFLREAEPATSYLGLYSDDIGVFFALNRLASNLDVGPGRVLRVLFVAGLDTIPKLPREQQAAIQALFETGLLAPLVDVGVNPYPRPGTLGDPKPFTGSYPRVPARDR